jgi:cell division protein FtsI (penicillin-binding protein 3)
MAKPAARILLMQVLLGVGALTVAGRAVMLQVVQHDAWDARAVTRDKFMREIPARRGTIYDRHGVPLAITQERYRLNIAANEVRDLAELKTLLTRRLGVPAAEVERRFQRPYPYFHGPFSAEQVEPVRRMRGVHLEVLYGRSYPRRPMGSDPLLGEIDDQANRGIAGLERMLDTLLRGVPGEESVIRAPRGQQLTLPGSVVRPATPGRDVVLTLDHEWQAIAEGVLRRTVALHEAEGGDVVIFEVKTGELLALASLRPGPRAGRRDPSSSMLTEPYDPGSTAKIFTAAAMLRARSDTTPVSGEGGVWKMVIGRTEREFRDVSRQSGLLTPGLAVRYSSNIAMAKFALRIPADSHYVTLRDFGFGTPTGLGFPAESRGLLAPPARSNNLYLTQTSWSEGYEMTATAVQVAAGYGAIANDGILMAPALVREVRDGVTGAVRWRHAPQAVREAVPSEVASQLLTYLKMSSDSGAGGASARLDRTPVIGKTGTAVLLNAAGKYGGAGHRASFAGIFPGDDPQIVLYVMINRPNSGEIYGGRVAAPMVRDILQQILATPSSPLDRSRWLERVVMPAARPRETSTAAARLVRFPLDTTDGAGTPMLVVPHVGGRLPREAIHLLHQRGFTVQLRGTGTITHSEPMAGDSLPAGATVTLFTGPAS